MQALLDAAVDAVIVIDHRGLIHVANHSAERLFGYSADELSGCNVSRLMPEPDRGSHDGYIDRYIASRVPRVIGRGREVTALRRDGSTFPVALSVGVVPGADPPRFAGFVRDLSEQRAKDAEVRHAHERLAQVARFASMGEMAAGLSHELNQPLAAIATYAQASERLLAQPDAQLEDVQEALRQIASQALRAGEVIRRLRHLVGDRKTEHHCEAVNEVVEEIASLAAWDLRQSGVTLHFQLDPALPAIAIDRVQIQQVLLNLVRNGIDAMESLPQAQRRISLSTRRDRTGRIEIAVRDTGPGVAPDAVGRMFDPFFTTKPEGTGLGLAISRTIARAHHGTLGYRPSPPEFFLSLPAAQP